ncbi:MAG: type IV pilin protein [Bdellovibrionales bacterium]
MVVGIIGILAAVAIPAYDKYQTNAKEGVVESVLLSAQRQVDVRRSLNKETTTADFGSIQSKGAALGDSAFTMWGTPASGTAGVGTIGTSGAWCIAFVKENVGTGGESCIDSAGAINYGDAASLTTATSDKCKADGSCTGT